MEQVLDAQGRESRHVFELAWLNSHFETGLKAALDEAILAHGKGDASGWRKLDEVPFDFERRRVSVLLERQAERLLVVKGAPEDILRLTVAIEGEAGPQPLDDEGRARINRLFDDCSARGQRLVAVASRRIVDGTTDVTAAHEHDLVFAGFVAFADPPKLSAAATLRSLHTMASR